MSESNTIKMCVAPEDIPCYAPCHICNNHIVLKNAKMDTDEFGLTCLVNLHKCTIKNIEVDPFRDSRTCSHRDVNGVKLKAYNINKELGYSEDGCVKGYSIRCLASADIIVYALNDNEARKIAFDIFSDEIGKHTQCDVVREY